MNKNKDYDMQDMDDDKEEYDDKKNTVKEAIDTFRELLANAYTPDDQPELQHHTKKKSVPDHSDVEMEEDFDALFEGQDLSEDFKMKIATIFEAKVYEKSSDMKKNIEQMAEKAIEKTVEKMHSKMEESVDNYLSYVATQFVKENELAITEGLRYEIAESFMEGLKSLFMEHNVEIPEEKIDLISVMEEKIADLESVLNESVENFVDQNAELCELKEKVIFDSMTANLASTEKDRLSKLAESIEFIDEETYKKKLGILIENYSTPHNNSSDGDDAKKTTKQLNEENLSPGKIYANFINKTSTRN